MDDNMTLMMDPETRDLVMEDTGSFVKIYGDETAMQCVRNTLLTWLGEFFADEEHGTEYERILGLPENRVEYSDLEEVLREAALQEEDVAWVDSVDAKYEDRVVTAEMNMTFQSGESASLEVAI